MKRETHPINEIPVDDYYPIYRYCPRRGTTMLMEIDGGFVRCSLCDTGWRWQYDGKGNTIVREQASPSPLVSAQMKDLLDHLDKGE